MMPNSRLFRGLVAGALLLPGLFGFGPLAWAQSAEAVKATIGVMSQSDFMPDRVAPQRGRVVGMPDVLAGRIIEHLANSNRFDLVDRTALRRVVLEQRSGQALRKTYLDRTLDKAIDAMENVEGGFAVVPPDRASPVGRARVGGGAVGTTGTLSDYNDLIKDFQDLGTTLGADYLVLGNLEKVERSSRETAVPYSDSGRTVTENKVDARLQLRVIRVKTGTVAGAASIRTKLSESVFEGRESDTDAFTLYDRLGRLAATRILDITFPARIVSLEPLVISRGINDGVEKGDRYRIRREGKEIKDASGLVIARLKSDIGQVRVMVPQETVSIVTPVAGDAFTLGDLAVLDTSSDRDTGAVAQQAAVPLQRPASTAALAAGALPRVAVGLVKTVSTARTGLAAGEHTPLFTDTIISRLSQTRRFQLVDRQEVDQLLDEQLAQALAENRDMPSAMGTLKGADYLVYGSLAAFSIEDQTQRLPGSSRSFTRRIGTVEGNMRIVDARSGDVLASRKISVSQPLAAQAGLNRAVTELADAYAEQVVLMLMNAVYPIKVAHVAADGTVYVNRGDDGGLYKGEVLTAYSPGQAIIDPDTGVQLGVEETPVGQVRITEVEEARSKGLVQGGRLVKGDILKRSPDNRGRRASAANREQASAPQRSGGVMAGGERPAAGRPQDRLTIAVGRLKLTPGARTSRMVPGTVQRVSDELILKLHDSNRFRVMERQEVDQVLDEKTFEAIAAGGDIQDRLRELQGADYLIHGTIINYYLDIQQRKVPYLDEIQTTGNAVAEGIFRIVDVHSGAVTGGTKVEVRKKYTRIDDLNRVFADLRDRFTTRAVASIVGRLYPVKVLGVTADGVVYLNRGADAGLQRGARFDVMRPGTELIDPDTGRSFGAAESRVGSLEITAVEANRSRALLLDGATPRTGDILREARVAEKKPEPEVLQPAW